MPKNLKMQEIVDVQGKDDWRLQTGNEDKLIDY